jgi:hypothetical protein
MAGRFMKEPLLLSIIWLMLRFKCVGQSCGNCSFVGVYLRRGASGNRPTLLDSRGRMID